MSKQLLVWASRIFLKFSFTKEKAYYLKIPPELYEEVVLIAKKNNVSALKIFRAFFKLGLTLDAVYRQGGAVFVKDEDGAQKMLVLFTNFNEEDDNIVESNVIDFEKIKKKKK